MNIDFHVFVDNFILAVEAKDAYTAGHSDRVADLAQLLSKALHMTEEDQHTIHMAAHLHDIGKIGIPDGILLKTGKLTPAEFEVMKSHAEIGHNILKNNKGLIDIANMILHHHEKFDGSGYPNKVSGYDIPVGARIISICDAFDAMVTKRTYKETMTIHEALEEIQAQKGGHFDPQISEVFIGLLRDKHYATTVETIVNSSIR